MQPDPQRRLDSVAAIGLAAGAVCGMAGVFVAQASLRQVLWGIDSIGLIVASALLTLKYFRKNCIAVAAGFLVFALGETLLLSGTPASLTASVPSFGAGIALWATAFVLISVPAVFRAWVRIAGFVAAILFLIPAAEIFWGRIVLPISRPLPYFGYPFAVLTMVGWILALVKTQPASSTFAASLTTNE